MSDAPEGSRTSLVVDAEATIVDARAAEGPDLRLAWLLVIRSEDQKMEGQLLELVSPETSLGRGGSAAARPPAHFRFDDAFMSEPHALLTRTDDPEAPLRLRERPGQPTNNGTWHNGRRLRRGEQVVVRDGDRLRLGTTELVVKTLWLDGGPRPRARSA